MVAMIQRQDASGLFFCAQLSVAIFLALVLKIFRNRCRCHSQSVAELSSSKLSKLFKLSNCGHSVRIHGLPQIGTLRLFPKLHFVVRSVS